tara:strand:- start:159 stop:1694 length:1536 start_codon:yes stop_codon:yes gene_type:complete
MIKRALISVWDKEGLLELGQFLDKNGVEIVSTGGTEKYLSDNGIPVIDISEITGMGAVMDGRVKTLNPKIFGGILADRKNENHLKDLNSIDGKPIDLIVVNLYPFVDEAVKNNLPMDKAIEYIDIGGPSMLRAAAKNYHSVCVLSDVSDYSDFMNSFDVENKDINLEWRKNNAANVFLRTSNYDSNIFQYFNKQNDEKLPESKIIPLVKKEDLRYGENPHQMGAFYTEVNNDLKWIKHQGKALSYNNYMDLQSAFDIVSEFEIPSCSIIKHSNPCGFATGQNLVEAYSRAVSCDPVSYFGGIVAFNDEVDAELAGQLVEPFLECIIAPSFSSDALSILQAKKNLRVITLSKDYQKNKFEIRSASGGYLIQEADSFKKEEFDKFKIVTKKEPGQDILKALDLGWKIVRYVKSNAIVIANKDQILGVGAGQMSRIDSVKNAIRKIQEFDLNLNDSIMASDAFFPFADSLELASSYGISSIIQPGGSIKDKEIIESADKLNMSMIFTSTRHFYH